jgi:hypothetical protein
MKCYSAPALKINDYDSNYFTLPVQFISPAQTAEHCNVYHRGISKIEATGISNLVVWQISKVSITHSAKLSNFTV